MKIKHLFFSILVAAFLTSAMTVDKKLEVGNKAPKIETTQGINVVDDANSEAKTKIVSFWSPKIPASRISNKKLSREYGDAKDENIEYISICTDKDENLMREVMKIDGISGAHNFSYSQISPRTFKDYGVEGHPKAFIISPQGKIEKIM